MTEGEAVRVCAQTIGRADFVIPASFEPHAALPESAQPGEDFPTNLYTFELPASSAAIQCVEVQATDDNVVERSEVFQVLLAIGDTGNSRVALGDDTTATITITDNDCESFCWSCDSHVMQFSCVDANVGFEFPEYSIIEGEGEITVCAAMTGNLTVPISVTFSIVDPPERDASK